MACSINGKGLRQTWSRVG